MNPFFIVVFSTVAILSANAQQNIDPAPPTEEQTYCLSTFAGKLEHYPFMNGIGTIATEATPVLRCLYGTLEKNGNLKITKLTERSTQGNSEYPPLLAQGELTQYCQDFGFRLGYVNYSPHLLLQFRDQGLSLELVKKTLKTAANIWYEIPGHQNFLAPVTEMKCLRKHLPGDETKK